MINKEQIVFLAALAIFVLGMLALVTGAPGGKELPVVPPEASADRDIADPTVAALFPPAIPVYSRDPFAASDAWAPPRAGVLPRLPEFPVAYAVPRPTIAEGMRVEIPYVQPAPPQEVAEAEPEEDEDGEGEEGDEESDEEGDDEE